MRTTDEKHKIVWSVVSQQDFKDTESTEDQTGDIIDELMTNAPGAEVILLMKEKADKTISVSIRTTSDAVEASKIAESFGGGGHNRAAGFTLKELDLREAEYKVINQIREYQSDRLGLIHAKEQAQQTPEPMIDVEGLKKRAKDAERASEMMTKATSPKPETPEQLAQEEELEKEEKPKKKAKKAALKLKTPGLTKQTTPKKKEVKSKYKFEN